MNFTVSQPAELVADAGNVTVTCSTAVQLTASGTGGSTPYTYAWSPAGSLNNPTLQTPDANPTQSTTYTLVITDNAGCTQTDTVSVLISCVGTENFAENEGWILYPNPSNGQVWIDLGNGYFADALVWEVTNSEGQVVASEQLSDGSKLQQVQLNLTRLAKGAYQISLKDGNQVSTKNLIIQ